MVASFTTHMEGQMTKTKIAVEYNTQGRYGAGWYAEVSYSHVSGRGTFEVGPYSYQSHAVRAARAAEKRIAA